MIDEQPKTPGIHGMELSAMPLSVAGVDTSIPVFIGHTEKALLNGASILQTPTQVDSFAQVQAFFGGYPQPKFLLETTTMQSDLEVGGVSYAITQDKSSQFYLYNSLRLFYENGGGDCFVVSVGDYSNAVDQKALAQGLDSIARHLGPTMLVVPDALLLDEAGYSAIVQKMLQQCGTLRDRFAILDVHGSDALLPLTQLDALATAFRQDVGAENLSYGAAYFPCLQTSMFQSSDVDLLNFDLTDPGTVKNLAALLQAEAGTLPQNADVENAIQTLCQLQTGTAPSADAIAANKVLVAQVPGLQRLFSMVVDKLNIQPPSGSIAGVYAQNDRQQGVWTVPANVPLAGVIAPTMAITDAVQSDLNTPSDGKAINAIREFVNRGTVIWGARTLDGNSNDYRYIQVRRTLIYIEQSIKNALQQYIFAANDRNTWTAVTATISNFLTDLWRSGAIMGAKPSDAFSVQCGIGQTMTSQDILNGYMRVQVQLALIHPAEFIVLTFEQTMGSAS